MHPPREIRAAFDDTTITVYQAYPPAIADSALRASTFAPPFKRDRMTWIKPSFLWMMYRCGWATKPGQERVLAVTITRTGFEETLRGACLSHFDRTVYADAAAWAQRKRATEVRVQWDPERTPSGSPLPYRSLQVGLSGQAVDAYLDHWIVGLRDLTAEVRELRAALRDDADVLPGTQGAGLPVERPYPLPDDVAAIVGATRDPAAIPAR